MGVIQNAINQSMVTIGAAVYGVKNIRDKTIEEGRAALKEDAKLSKEVADIGESAIKDEEKVSKLEKDVDFINKETQALVDIRANGGVKSEEDEQVYKNIAQDLYNQQQKNMVSRAVLQQNIIAKQQSLKSILAQQQKLEKQIKKGRSVGGKY